jgi:Phytanoyl-CoA dioxygenase (PhyH)
MFTSNGYVLDESPARLGSLEPVPRSERHDRAALWRRLRSEGYLFLKGALDPSRVLAFRDYYFSKLASADGPASLRRVLFREIVPGAEYHAFCTQPAIRDWYAWFLGGSPFLHRRKILRALRPGETGVGTATQAHYDLLYLRGGTDQVLTSWIPLGDCPTWRGSLIYLERSHVQTRTSEGQGDRPPAASITADLPGLASRYDSRWLVADYEAGDMVVHSAYLVHASLDNVASDGETRLSTDIRYQRASDEIDGRWQNHWHDRDGL